MVEQQGRPAWGGRRAQRLTAAVLARDYAEDLGYTPCRWCQGPASTADHWPIARAEGGPDTLDNLVPACRPCNTARGVRLWEQRRQQPIPSRRW
jgi:5-methylcytosine-specific restriction endonuclease McrA